MKTFLRASLLIFAFCLSALSQTDANSACPKLEVSGPAGITNPGEAMTFTASLDEKAKNYNIEYIWSISIGEITKGQGTSTIETTQNNLGFGTTVTVEIKGLPEGCPNNESEYAPYCSPLASIHIDEFSTATTRIDKARIDYFLTELLNNPNDQGYIIEYFERKTSRASINQKLKKLREYISKIRRFDGSRITIVQSLADENRTMFYRVPPGAENPSID